MSDTIEYREIDATNFDEARAFKLTHEYAFRDSNPEGYKEPPAEEMDRRARKLMELLEAGKPRLYCLGAFVEDRLVGSVFLEIWDLQGRDACHVHGLWTEAAYRRKGIARELKVRAEVWGREQRCDFMDTNVDVSNAGMIALNEELGYEVARFNFRKPLGGVDSAS